MHALVLKATSEFVYEKAPTPSPGSQEVRIRVHTCGICGSDVHGMDGSTGRRQPPVIMGHEAAGIVDAVGDGVTQWKPGDRVTFDSTVYCGRCFYCRAGRVNLCENRMVLGVSCDDYRRDGAFAEFVCVPEHIVYRVPDAVSLEQAAMVEPVSVAVHAVGLAGLSLNAPVAVVGTGMIGLLVVQAARAAGCGLLIAVDLEEQRLELAKSLGADVGIAADGNAVERIRALTGGLGVAVAFEVVGAEAPLQTAIAATRKGGTVVLVGNVSPEAALPLQSVVTREIALRGSCASSGEYPACLDLMARDAIRVEPLMSACAPLSEGAEWFERLYRKESGLMKVLLQPAGGES